MNMMGHLYANGIAVAKNATEAVRWFNRSASTNFSLAYALISLSSSLIQISSEIWINDEESEINDEEIEINIFVGTPILASCIKVITTRSVIV